MCTWDLSQTKGEVLVYVSDGQKNKTHNAQQELPDEAANTPAYISSIARRVICLHIAGVLRNTKTQIAVARKPNQSDVSK